MRYQVIENEKEKSNDFYNLTVATFASKGDAIAIAIRIHAHYVVDALTNAIVYKG